ncbi:NAD-dependent epimerase/dehydratase family protein [Labedella phragmitis]|uniref:NAD-dependent epimerase/dehydratase family protein n=1 Tax=Labedella phragmitis TaxID=2498849 RepID=A0A444PP50_9MICO|nr:NAD(P)H-binding protein [Labedella phragmitis]RWZ46227.1 NAD-dependent epimerase/dehydratase family protein [Labedella phragmitis]
MGDGVVTPLVAVFGASGQTGRRVVDRLVEGGRDVIALGRSVDGRWGSAPHVRTSTVDLAHVESAELVELLEGVDAVVFAAAGDPERVDRDGAIRVIGAAERAGVARFVLLTGMGVGRSRPAALYGGFWDSYFGAKEESERRLRASTLSWTIIQPGELLASPGSGRVALAATGALPIGAVSRDDVAGVITAALENAASAGHTWELVRGDDPIADAIARASA